MTNIVSFEEQLKAALDSALAEMRPHLEDELRPCIQDVARAAADASSTAAVGQIAAAIREFENCRSLAETLDVLARAVVATTPGAALFVVSGGRYRLWRGLACDVPLPAAGVIEAGIPVRVGGTAVAYVCAHEPNPALEILASHAGKVLEALTMQQAVGL